MSGASHGASIIYVEEFLFRSAQASDCIDACHYVEKIGSIYLEAVRFSESAEYYSETMCLCECDLLDKAAEYYAFAKRLALCLVKAQQGQLLLHIDTALAKVNQAKLVIESHRDANIKRETERAIQEADSKARLAAAEKSRQKAHSELMATYARNTPVPHARFDPCGSYAGGHMGGYTFGY